MSRPRHLVTLTQVISESLLCLIISTKICRTYCYIVTTIYLWDYTVLLSCNQLSAQFSACVFYRPRSTISTKKLPESTLRKEGSLLKGSWSTTGCIQPKPKCRNQRTLPEGGVKSRCVWRSKPFKLNEPKECPKDSLQMEIPVVERF